MLWRHLVAVIFWRKNIMLRNFLVRSFGVIIKELREPSRTIWERISVIRYYINDHLKGVIRKAFHLFNNLYFDFGIQMWTNLRLTYCLHIVDLYCIGIFVVFYLFLCWSYLHESEFRSHQSLRESL